MGIFYLQTWGRYSSPTGIISDGCSLHVGLDELKKYSDQCVATRDEEGFIEIPDGDWREVYCDEILAEELSAHGTLRLDKVSFDNLVGMEAIVFI